MGFGFLLCPTCADAHGPYKVSASPWGWLPGEGGFPGGGVSHVGGTEKPPLGFELAGKSEKRFCISCSAIFLVHFAPDFSMLL